MIIPSFLLEALSSKGSLQTFLIVITMYLGQTLWRKRTWRRTVALVNTFPGSRTYGVFGNPSEIYTIASDPTRNLLKWCQGMAEKYGSIYKLWVLGRPQIFVADAEIATYLYTKNCVQGKTEFVYKVARALGGEGLMALPAEIHPRRRKQWNPGFSRKQIENSMRFFRQQAVRLCDELEKHAERGSIFDLVPLSVECTFRTICYSAFGEEYMRKIPDSVGRQHVKDLHTVSLSQTSRVFRPFLWNDFLYFNLTKEGRETCVRKERTLDFLKQAVYERRETLQQQQAAESMPRPSDDFECFLDHLCRLMAAGELTETEVVCELNVFIIAGYDTSGLAICYVLYLLSRYPEHQAKVVDELCRVVPPENWSTISNYTITSACTKKMKYLELCIKEALRLYPILPISPRSTTHDVTLPDGRVIPAGVDVLLDLSFIHRDRKFFPEPSRFWPERHLEPNPAFMPFALGSRNCIGQVYAMFEMKVILAQLLLHYQWENMVEGELTSVYQTLQVPEDGLHFKITRRQFK